ncbi:MAG: CAP domain-containing protein, partial [Pyrinomonadaceae bacterium]|nr:CAP domain-containing protein [Pyrinomonadaceae bacterium]
PFYLNRKGNRNLRTQSRALHVRKAGYRSEVILLARLSFSIAIIAISAFAAAAQTRERPKAVLFDEIGPSGRSANERVRVISTGNPVTKADVSTDLGVERLTFELMNAERAANGLSPLKWNETLARVARLHSASMAENSYFSHRGIDGSMVDDRAAVYGVTNWLAIGENIAYLRGYEEPEATAIKNWLNSPSHKKNMLSTQWRESAIGVALKAVGTYYFTQVFILNR